MDLRRTLITGICLGWLLLPATRAADVATDIDLAPYRTEARQLGEELGAALREELQAALATGGPLAAVGTCRNKALPIANAISDRSGWEVGRTSLRVRNPDNAPDFWERQILERFEQRADAGESPATIEQDAVIRAGEHRYYRYMKAIATAEPCTVCHGESIAPALQVRLQELYPDDRATGFRAGELRGAFTMTRRIDP